MWWLKLSEEQIKEIYRAARASPHCDFILNKLVAHGVFSDYDSLSRYIRNIKIRQSKKVPKEIPYSQIRVSERRKYGFDG